ncbi:MAG: MATE family efflux transporter [Oscillospiraceae bacterium]|nr:MATE family efflux transporter [Oscillospiraceae bacterium]
MNKDLTVGSPGKSLVMFTIPLFVSVIFQQMYSIADSVIAGKFAGESALAAIGASYPITMIFMAVAVGCQIGCSVVISKHFGAGNMQMTKTCISTSLIAGTVLSVVLTAVGVLFSGIFMELVQTPADIFDDGCLYLMIYTGGFIFLFLYNVVTGIFNSLGDSKTPLYLLIASSVGNIVLDIIFIIPLKMGVAGAAWATFAAQGAACIMALALLFRRLKYMNIKGGKLFSGRAIAEIGKVAIPSVLQQSFISVGNLFIQYMVNSFDSSAIVAGYSAAIKLNTFAITCFTTIGNGMSSFTAQNIGAKKPERIRQGFRSVLIFSLGTAALFFLLFFILNQQLLSLFMNDESSQLAMDTGVKFLQIVSPFYFVVCLKLLCDGVLRGSESMGCFMAATFTDLILRVVLAEILSRFMGVDGIWTSWPIAWTCGTVMSIVFYKSGVWSKKLKITE